MRALVAMAPLTAQRLHALGHQPQRLHGVSVDVAMVDLPPPNFDPGATHNAQAVLVRVEAFSCNFRERARIIDAARRPDGRGYVVLGSELCGTVVAVGREVRTLSPGDRVCGDGSVEVGRAHSHPGLTTQQASAELQVIDHRKLLKIPDEMSAVAAASFSVGAQTSYAMARRIDLPSGADVAVAAAGSNTGLFAIPALVNRGYRVHPITTSEGTASRLAEHGIQACLVSKNDDASKEVSSWLSQRGIQGFDGVVDPFCDMYVRKLLPFLKRFGAYVTCGAYQQFEGSDSDAFVNRGLSVDQVFSLVIRKSLRLIGNNLGTTSDLEQALRDFQEGRLPLFVDSVHSPDDVANFVDRSFIAGDRFGKVVMAYGNRATPHPARHNQATPEVETT